MKTKTTALLLWGKRLLVYVLGLYIMAVGVVCSSRSALGVTPVSSLGNVLYLIGSAAGAPAFVNLGNCTTGVFCLYLLAEFLVLRREFKHFTASATYMLNCALGTVLMLGAAVLVVVKAPALREGLGLAGPRRSLYEHVWFLRLHATQRYYGLSPARRTPPAFASRASSCASSSASGVFLK